MARSTWGNRWAPFVRKHEIPEEVRIDDSVEERRLLRRHPEDHNLGSFLDARSDGWRYLANLAPAICEPVAALSSLVEALARRAISFSMEKLSGIYVALIFRPSLSA